MTLKEALKKIGRGDCQECTWGELIEVKKLLSSQPKEVEE